MAEPLRNTSQDDALVKQRRRQIFLAACRVLARKSFHEATVKELALEAGLAAGSIYVYLQSKDDILFLMVESMVGELTEMLPAIRRDAGDDPRAELLGVMRAVLDVIDRYRAAFGVVHHEGRYLGKRPAYRAALHDQVERYHAAVREPLERGMRAGLIRCAEPRAMVWTIHMLCAGWATGADYLKGITLESYWRDIAAMVEARFVRAGAK